MTIHTHTLGNFSLLNILPRIKLSKLVSVLYNLTLQLDSLPIFVHESLVPIKSWKCLKILPIETISEKLEKGRQLPCKKETRKRNLTRTLHSVIFLASRTLSSVMRALKSFCFLSRNTYAKWRFFPPLYMHIDATSPPPSKKLKNCCL